MRLGSHDIIVNMRWQEGLRLSNFELKETNIARMRWTKSQRAPQKSIIKRTMRFIIG
jgi:hypothetical protein